MQTFRLISSTNKSTLKNKGGFTLVELLVVVALIALITALVLPNVAFVSRWNIDSAARKFSSVVKKTYNSTIVTGKVHRLVFDLKEDTYMVEVGPSTVLLDTEKSRELDDERGRNDKSSNDGDEDTEKPSGFTEAKDITKKQKFDSTIDIVSVHSEQSLEPIKEGLAYVHFFPHGVTEQAVIHLEDTQENKKTLAITPLVGRTIVENDHLTQEEVFGD